MVRGAANVPQLTYQTASGRSPARNCFKQFRAVSGAFRQFQAVPETARKGPKLLETARNCLK
eukprot:8789189-Alexandrium_andersonii.AAC.1